MKNKIRPTLHDAVLVGIMSNVFLVFVIVFLIFATASFVSVVAAAPENQKINDNNTLFIGHPEASEFGFDINVNDLPHIASRRIYSFNVAQGSGFSANIHALVRYDANKVANNPCLKAADLDIFLRDEDGDIIGQDDRVCDSGVISLFVENRSGPHTLEVIGNYGTTLEYDLSISVQYFDVE